MTASGTGTFIVGDRTVAVIDPGPPDDAHLAALLRALDGCTLTHIVVTHTHRDHSPLARALKAATGAPIVGCAPHAEAAADGADHDHAPDQVLGDGEAISGPGWSLRALATPGHTANHLAFALPQAGVLFSGDAVMAWNTTVVSPPDGDMAAYFATLSRLGAHGAARFLPTHGPAVEEPAGWCAALLAHRRAREAQVVSALGDAPVAVEALVATLYPGLDPRVRGAAARSVLAHLLKLSAEGRARMGEGGWRGVGGWRSAPSPCPSPSGRGTG
jgi:glyoxylase-like metal-dependent hydrolase (beta-lactamase superfamily II)